LYRRGRQIDRQAVIEKLYVGTTDEKTWTEAINEITDFVGGASSNITGVNPRTGQLFRAETYRVDPQFLETYRTEWFDREIRLEPAMRLPAGEGYFESRLLPTRVWKRSDIYNDFLSKIDRPWFLCFWLHKNPAKLSAFAIHGSGLRGQFDSTDVARVQPFVPHLQRALAIRDRVEASRLKIGALTATMDRLPFGVIVLDQNRRILECNVTAAALMTRQSGLSRQPDGCLRVRGRGGTQLHRWMLGETPPEGIADGLLRVRGVDGSVLSIMAMPLPKETPSWMAGDAAWVLLVFDPNRQKSARTELLRQDLDISDREAELAALLVQGLDVAQVAAQMNISVHTARTHLKSIFAKTGHGSQAELIRRILTGPAGTLSES